MAQAFQRNAFEPDAFEAPAASGVVQPAFQLNAFQPLAFQEAVVGPAFQRDAFQFDALAFQEDGSVKRKAAGSSHKARRRPAYQPPHYAEFIWPEDPRHPQHVAPQWLGGDAVNIAGPRVIKVAAPKLKPFDPASIPEMARPDYSLEIALLLFAS